MVIVDGHMYMYVSIQFVLSVGVSVKMFKLSKTYQLLNNCVIRSFTP